jgi:glycosyltransferase involved in cell wall biosynthesis
MTDPLVSILVPTYNGERFLRPALRSALEQSYRSIEVVVGDDASTDGTPDLLASVAAKDARVRVVRHERNVGGGENPARLFEAARGEYVKFLMHDDVLATDCVRDLVRGMQANPSATLAFSRRVLIDENGRPVAGHEFPRLRDRPCTIDGRELGDAVLESCTNIIGEPTTVLFRRSDVDPAELWKIDGRTVDVLNDVQLWLLLLSRGPAFYTPSVLSRFRRHPGQASASSTLVGRGERDWARLVDWGARNGFLVREGQRRRAQARALLEAAARVHQLVDTEGYGPALEAAYLSTAALVELARPAAARSSADLAERSRGAAVRGLFDQELDVWTRQYGCALAAPSLDPADVRAAVQAFREVLAAGVAKRLLVAVPPDDLEQLVPLVEAALAEGPDVDVEVVPTDEPAKLLAEPWLAVAARGSGWHDMRSAARWLYDVPVPGAPGGRGQ